MIQCNTMHPSKQPRELEISCKSCQLEINCKIPRPGGWQPYNWQPCNATLQVKPFMGMTLLTASHQKEGCNFVISKCPDYVGKQPGLPCSVGRGGSLHLAGTFHFCSDGWQSDEKQEGNHGQIIAFQSKARVSPGMHCHHFQPCQK